MNALTVELVITEACNLGCTYCYMENKPTYMTPEMFTTFQQTVGTVMSVYQKEKYSVSFFGGEPLLNWDLIKFAVPRLKADPRCDFSVVITNGLLLDTEKFTWLKENGCGVSLSFDGLWNNVSRPLKQGSPSLPSYMNKLEFFRRVGLNGCKVMVSPASLPTLVENFKFFIDECAFPCPDFALVRDDIWSWEDVDLFKDKIVDLAEETIIRFEAGSANMPGFFSLMLADIFIGATNGKRPMGCFAGCSGVGFLPNGIYYPCARFGSEKSFPLLDTTTEHLYLENIDELKKPTFCNPKAYKSCVGCDIRLYCNGGCNKSFFKKGRNKQAEPIPQLCELFKTIFKETLRVHNRLKNMPLYKSYIQNLYYLQRS